MNPFEFAYNGLVTGGDTDYGLLLAQGFSPPETRVDETQYIAQDGSLLFADFLDKRTITLQFDVTGDIDSGDFEAKLSALKAAFSTPQASDQPLKTLFPGQGVRRVYCKPVKTDYDVDLNYGLGYAVITFQFEAGDPAIYDDVLSVLTLEAPIPGGATFPISFPVSFGGGPAGQINAVNSGTFKTFPVVHITGPCDNPQVENLTQGKLVKVNITLGVGDVLDLDFKARTVLFNGVSRYTFLDTSSQWWSLQPGDNTVDFRADSPGGAASATFTYRSAWI